MDKQEYLNQISADVAPTPKKIPSFLTSKFFWIIIGCIFFMIFILIVGNIATSGRVTVKDRVIELLLHIDNTNNSVDTYRENLKSSALRSYSASLNSVLSDTSNKLTAFATSAYEYKPKNVDPKVVAAATTAAQELNDELFVAKINGSLDNMYDLKMVYEISTIMTQEEAILAATKNEDLTGILSPSLESLSTIYKNFDEYEVGASY